MLDIGSKSHQGIDNCKNFVDNYNSVLEDKKKKKNLMTPQEIIATNSYRLNKCSRVAIQQELGKLIS